MRLSAYEQHRLDEQSGLELDRRAAEYVTPYHIADRGKWLSHRVVRDDGRVIAQVYGRPSPDVWEAIQREVADFLGCSPDEVDSGEDEDGEFVVVDGEIIGRFA